MKWFYLENGQPAGPYTEEEMAKLVSSGRINASTFAAREGSEEWLPLERACHGPAIENATASARRRPGHWTVAVRLVFLLLAGLLFLWPLAALFGTISFLPSPDPMARLYFYAFLAYPVVLGISWWQARRLIRRERTWRAFLWALPPFLIMSPLIWGFALSAAYPIIQVFNRYGTEQGRFTDAIIRHHSAELVAQHLARGADPNRLGGGTFC